MDFTYMIPGSAEQDDFDLRMSVMHTEKIEKRVAIAQTIFDASLAAMGKCSKEEEARARRTQPAITSYFGRDSA
jgi:hypothetical protein